MGPGPEAIKYFNLNPTEHEIYPANKCLKMLAF